MLAAALFGISATLNKIVLVDVHPLVVAGLIYFSAGILLVLIRFLPAFKKISKKIQINTENKELNRTNWFYLIIIAVCGAVIAPFLFLHGLNISTAVNASLLLNAEVLFTVFIAFIFLKERANTKDYFAMIILFLAAIVVTTNLNLSEINFTGKLLGNLFIIGGTLFWALDNSLSKKLGIENDVVKVASFKSLIGGSIVILIAIILQIPFNITLHMIPYILFVGFFSIGLSIVLFLSSLRMIGLMKTAVIYSTSALFGALSAFIILGEPISAIQLIAGTVMIYAIYLMSRKIDKTLSLNFSFKKNRNNKRFIPKKNIKERLLSNKTIFDSIRKKKIK
ncbi:MAG: DMT family transporter [Candidatus Aenigmarchaeota archaeon]|nr:DMT family transporter [Candidatus Aenigmarchaeota archaeon]